MTTTVTAQHTAAAKALAGLLPSSVPLVTQLAASVPFERLGSAVTASFVGTVSADFALVVTDLGSVDATPDAPRIEQTDLLRPALDAAAAALGVGVLGEVRTASATELAGDVDSITFELVDAGRPVGWFVIRVRENGTVMAPASTIAPTASVGGRLGRINNVEMALTVEIGRTRMSVRDVLGLEPGAVIELDRSAGAPADVLLNGRLIAHGEVVVVDQDYAVRITQILDLAEGQN
ncbi:flagellar motor switch protein FliN [Frondihabitans cladoniiphilus]|uniref:Flagellar motor switch protein FliN-like C-terminal domain-containing protein n=1 Tax=Frondihabitans cladoniiphilus TaxID=715785 RepID=A0ABP8VWT0_9MICO